MSAFVRGMIFGCSLAGLAYACTGDLKRAVIALAIAGLLAGLPIRTD